MSIPRRIILFSTLNPYPFWAGSENLWFDLLQDERSKKDFVFHAVLAKSPVTSEKGKILRAAGNEVSYYHHLNVDFGRRTIYRVNDKLFKRKNRTLPWYNIIKKEKCDLVFFNVAALADLADLSYAADLCRKKNLPYWILLQHGQEDFFLTSEAELKKTREVATHARRFIFISKRNRVALERAIGQQLNNAFHSVNAIPAEKIAKGKALGSANPAGQNATARFFNLGRFSPRDKAQHLILEVLADKKWKERDWRLSFIGVSGFGKDSLDTLTRFYALDNNKIRIVAHTDNVLDAIIQEDVLLMPSHSEGTPFAMVESMACARPALGTPVGGIPELIIEGKTGWLTSSVDVGAIAEKLEQCWNEKENWAMYGLQAQQHISEQYNEDKSFEVLRELLLQDCN